MMKKFILIGLLLIQSGVYACDICGCGVGNQYIGILPEFRKHILGLRYRSSFMTTHLGAGGAISYLSTRETYQTMELWGGWNIGKSFRVIASIPLGRNSREQAGVRSAKTGLGDMLLSGYYNLLNKRSVLKESSLLVQSLWLGAGLKLPTGEYNPSDKSGGANQTNLFQLGTASVDVSLTAMYDIRWQDAGLNLNASYRLNSVNRYEYGYGNKFSLTPQLYYKWKAGKQVSLSPYAGLMYEQSRRDIDHGFLSTLTGGSLLMGSWGVEFSLNQLVGGMGWQTPLSQNLAGHSVRSGNRAMIHLGYSF